MKELWGADKLEAELAAAKDDLRGLEKNIRKILGREAPDGENGTVQQNTRIAQKRPLQEDRRRPVNQDFQNNGFPPKRRWQQGGANNNAEPKTVFSRLSARASNVDDSGDEDDGGFKPAVSSRVIATPREIPSRQDVIRRESTDERSRQRNKRMFGALLGTLQKFRQEETRLKAKEDKKAEVEARVEEAKRKEKEELKKERQQLFYHRKQQLAQVKSLEAKLARTKQYQEWRGAQIPLLNFIKTKAQPAIYYLPKRSIPETDTLIQESSKQLKAEIDRRERIMLQDLEIIQSQISQKNQTDKNMSLSDGQDQSMMEEEPEEEENRDPNPEKNGDIEMPKAEIVVNEEADTDTNANINISSNTHNTTFNTNVETDMSVDIEVDPDPDIVINPDPDPEPSQSINHGENEIKYENNEIKSVKEEENTDESQKNYNQKENDVPMQEEESSDSSD